MQTESVNNSVVVRQEVTGYGMRFDDIVTSPNYYRFEIEALQVANEKTPVDITVNTDGGSLATGIEMVNEIINCKAKVTGILRSSCHSCGSIIFLACDEHQVGLSSEMLLHSGSGGSGGTPSQSVNRAQSYKRQVRSLFETVYKGFLSQEEIDLMIEDDKEFIFCSDEIEERLNNMYKYRSEQQASAMEEMYTFQDEQADKYEKILVNKLLEKGVITKEEADIAYKVQQASLKLDEEEGDQLITALNKPVIENTVTEEHSTVVKGNSREYLLYYHIFDGEVVLGDLDFDDYALPLTLSCAEECYLVLKAVAADLNVSKSHNIKPENLMKKLIAHLEQLVEESL